MSVNADRPTPFVFRRGDWVKVVDVDMCTADLTARQPWRRHNQARKHGIVDRKGNKVAISYRDLTDREKQGIAHPDGNGDTPTAHKVLPKEAFAGTVEWAEGRIASASVIPMLSTLFAGFAIANLLDLDPDSFNSPYWLNVFMFCQSATIALNLHAAVVVAYLCMRSGELLASDRRYIADEDRRIKKNRAYIGRHGEHVAMSHALMANYGYMIKNGIKEFMWSIVFYLAAIIAFVADQYDRDTFICVAVPLAIGVIALFNDTRLLGMSLMPSFGSWATKKKAAASVRSTIPKTITSAV